MLPVLHNFNAIKGELISLNIGYNNVVASENLFACVRKYQWDLFIWNGNRPIKCLVKGQVDIIEGISNRGK